MKETSKFRERYNRWKNGENYWEIRADQDLPKFQSGKDSETNSQDPFGIVSIPINKIRKRAYRNINPLDGYNILENGKTFFTGDSLIYDNDKLVEFGDVTTPVQIVDDIWANYLQIPTSERRYNTRIRQSLYKPSVGGEPVKYYKLPLSDSDKDILISHTDNLNIGKNTVSQIFERYNLENHTIGRGYDSKGEYRSYYDRWDLNPFTDKYNGWDIKGLNKLKDASFGIGKPVHIYDRVYMDDYYGSPVSTHATYLPEIIVNGVNKTKKPPQLKPQR